MELLYQNPPQLLQLGCYTYPKFSMSKMSDSCKDHGQAVLVGHVNGVLVTDRTTWLDDSLDTCSCNFFHVISKWEEGVRRQNGSLQTVLGLLDSDTDGRYTVGLPGPTPKVILSLVMMMPLDLTYLEDFQANSMAAHSCSDG